jgi:hypothetical protein
MLGPMRGRSIRAERRRIMDALWAVVSMLFVFGTLAVVGFGTLRMFGFGHWQRH